MGKAYEVEKSYSEINARIKSGDVVVVTAEEMIGIVDECGPVEAARKVDVVTTGTFAPMCSSGAFLNIGQSTPTVRTTSTWFNNVPSYSGVAAVDCYLGATAICDDDPLNKVYPGEFRYGGGHVIEDLVAGKNVYVRADSYGTACYPNLHVEKEVTLDSLQSAVLCNPRNGYQNYNCAVNVTDKTVYTYMGTLKPKMGNANYCSAGELSPLMNDPLYKTIGIGTRIFLGGAQGYVAGPGTQHKPGNARGENDVPLSPAGTLWTMGDMKKMSSEWLRGVSMRGYGCSLSVGLGIPIPILNEEMARYTAVKDEEIFTQVVDYSVDYPNGVSRSLGQVSYKELKSGCITVDGVEVPTVPLSSMVKARAVAETLKGWIEAGDFFLGEPQELLPQS
ncbi:MAG: homocysteine biosynthesis protein [Desulfobacterales bacterium]|nr:homocysteine biosynthesis protein [Desulfobacterales bacterium]